MGGRRRRRREAGGRGFGRLRFGGGDRASGRRNRVGGEAGGSDEGPCKNLPFEEKDSSGGGLGGDEVGVGLMRDGGEPLLLLGRCEGGLLLCLLLPSPLPPALSLDLGRLRLLLHRDEGGAGSGRRFGQPVLHERVGRRGRLGAAAAWSAGGGWGGNGRPNEGLGRDSVAGPRARRGQGGQRGGPRACPSRPKVGQRLGRKLVSGRTPVRMRQPVGEGHLSVRTKSN